jgi:hypothetical protein
MRGLHLGLATLLVLCVGTAGSIRAGTIVFSDADFADSDWQIELFNFHTGGSTSAGQAATGGNPDAYLHVVHTVNAATDPGDNAAIYAFHGFNSAVLDPSVDGAIASVDFFWDMRSFPDVFGGGQFTGPALRQGSNYYVSAGLAEGLGTGQQWRSVSRIGLVAANYGLIQDILEIDPAQDPDFSASGAPITFGFFTALAGGLGGPGFSMSGGYDNWRVDVHTIPEPGLVVLLLLAGIVAKHRQRMAG